jgi:mannose-6-phosphate isomerase-like protein (cupin superfamily)
MTAIPVIEDERGAIGAFSDGSRAVWLLGMLIKFKAVAEETGGEYSLFEATVPPQVGAPPHIHHQEPEAFYVLEGVFEIIKGDGVVRASAGDCVHVPKGVAHGFMNVGQEPARLLAILTPGGWHEQLFAALGEPAKTETLPPPPAGPPDAQRMAETARRYGTEFLPPPFP